MGFAKHKKKILIAKRNKTLIEQGAQKGIEQNKTR